MADEPMKFPWGEQPRPKAVMSRRMKLLPVAAIGGIAVLATLSGAFYSVQPTELAFTRTFGRVDQPKNEPITPGVHFKLPFVTVVDRMQVSVDTVSPPMTCGC